jgi:ADP-dependent NAD(P)H-hydrate dehydratase / NAD(P)H-hydrate epimerase
MVATQLSLNLIENHPDVWRSHYPWPRPDDHKYKRGHVLVLGADRLTGASRLTAMAASRAGAGLVTLACAPAVWPVYATALTHIMVVAFEGLAGFCEILADEHIKVLGMGPGLEMSLAATDTTRGYVLKALSYDRATVLDAGALTAFADAPHLLFDALSETCVLTPHEGEFTRLFGAFTDRTQAARAAAVSSGAVIVLKGPQTLIAAPDGRMILNTQAPPYLATSGSGDVLTGFICGLMAQGMDAFFASAAGVWLHGAAAQHLGIGLIATDLAQALPAVLKSLQHYVKTSDYGVDSIGTMTSLRRINHAVHGGS